MLTRKYCIRCSIEGRAFQPHFVTRAATILSAAARGRSTYFYLAKACSGGNSRGKPIVWRGGGRGGRSGLPEWLKSAGRRQWPMVTTRDHNNYQSKRYTPTIVPSRTLDAFQVAKLQQITWFNSLTLSRHTY